MFPFFSNHGVLGLNARSLLYIRPFNPRKAIALADDKIRTKAFLSARGVPAARVYARIDTRVQARAFDFSQLPDECVLKPNYGFGGEGIILLKGRNKQGQFLRNGKEPISHQELREHIEDILDGRFSVNGRRDTAFFEKILKSHESFARFRPAGLPDIRVIVFNLVPVMAMLRIPTSSSEGKANVHLGGIGIGIDMATGKTTYAAQYHKMIKTLPHGEKVSGFQIPYWDEILLISSRIQQITNIGYLAVDITIDHEMGPALLEVNARAGLMVQVANLAPLRSRLERVKGIKVTSPEKGVRIGQDLFGQKKAVAEKNRAPDRPVLGLHERLQITLADGTTFEVPCRIAGDSERTMFAPELIRDLLDRDGIEPDEREGSYRVRFQLKGKKINTVVGMQDELTGPEQVMIGRRDLTGFLVDPTLYRPEIMPAVSVKADLRAVDSLFGQYDRALLLLKYLKPINLEEEVQRLREDALYNPVFSYAEVPVDLQEMTRKLKDPVKGDEPLALLLEKKRQELLQRIALLRSRGKNTEFTQESEVLFGAASSALIRAAQAALHNRRACDLPSPTKNLLTAEEAAERFSEVLETYGLHDWQVSVRPRLVADCTVGGRRVYIRSDATFAPLHVDALIAHEIETHVLTAVNGGHQPYVLFRRGLANYLDTQEGLAIYNQNRVLSHYDDKRYHPPRNVLAVAFALEHSFAETRKYLLEELDYSSEKAVRQTLMMKRGMGDTSLPGAFTKSLVYFRGLRAVEHFVSEGGKIEELYIGKVALEDLELVRGIPDLEKPLLTPNFLRVSDVKTLRKKKSKKSVQNDETEAG